MNCPRCSASVGEGGLYCSQCGAPLLRPAPSGSGADPARPAQERRQVTVLFYDLVDSTRLAQSADPEDFSEALAAFHQRVETEMSSLGGVVGPRLGDGAIVYFGYPEAYEDAAERAVLASLRAVEAATEVELPGGARAAARVGVATGPAVISRIGSGGRGNEVVGATANLAARLQAAATPGAVVIAHATRQLLGDLFRLEDLGPVSAKGFANGVRAWRVTGQGDTDRFRALRPGAAAPLVGRGAEISRLVSAWRRAAGGRGGVALIGGDPGVGKSRLAAALVNQPELAEAVVLRFFCTPHTQNAPLRPFADQMRRVSGIEHDDLPDQRRRKLGAALAPETTPEDAAILGVLMGLPSEPGGPLAGLEPAQRLDRTLGAMARQVQLIAKRRPVVALFEDAHWSDPTSLGLVEAFQRGAFSGRILLLVTARPEFRPSWATAARVTTVSLAPLQPEESDLLLSRIAGGKALPAAVRRLILHRADGVPLFLEEITRAVVEARRAEPEPTAPMDVPASLQDSLLARLDRLEDGKALAQVGAVIGREFSLELLAELAGQAPAALQVGLDQLLQAGLIVSRGAQRPAYLFRHVLIQESAASTLLKSERRRLNGRLVDVLETQFPDVARAEPERLARHAAEAGLARAAVGYWLKAGLQALSQSGMTEAISRLRAGLALAGELPADETRWRLELDLEVALGKALIATIGYAPPETGEAFARAQALCGALGEPPQALTVLHGLWTHDLIRGRLAAARARADELLAAGEARGDALRILMGCRFQGVTAFPIGEFETARSHLERGLKLFDPARRAAYAQITLDDGRVVMLTYLAWVLSYQGAADEARRCAENALAEALTLAQPYSTAHALNGLAYTLLLDGRDDAAAVRLEELSALTAEHGIDYYATISRALQGRCLLGQGDSAQAVQVLRRAIHAYRAIDSVIYLPTFMTWFAQALAREGRIAEGLRVAANAQALIRKTGMRFDQAATFEVEAELHLLAGQPAPAAERLQLALALATAQKAPRVQRRAREALERLRAAHPKVTLRSREALQTP
jgi:class 3 adenylate cyclase/tetratricopeptide (TPR) repeat protein